MSRRSHVALLGSLLGTASLLLPWLNVRSTRLTAGIGVGFFGIADTPLAAAVVALWAVALVASMEFAGGRRAVLLGIVGTALLPLSLLVAGIGSAALLNSASALSRASLAGGVWMSLLAVYLLLHTAQEGLRERVQLRRLLIFCGPVLVVALAACGSFDRLSLVVEFAGNEQRFFQELTRHVALTLGSVGIGASIAVPLGIAAARNGRARRPIFLISNTIETVPSLALFGLIIAPLSALSYAYPALRELGIRGVGATPALIALVLYSLLPIVHNTYAGMRQVPKATLDAGLGMGMSRRQLSWRVEYPLALPLIGEGIRTASVQSVGNTAVAALIGAGGLGHFIFQGLGQAAPDLILLGALPVIALALAIDVLMRMLIRMITPRGLGLEAGQ